MSSNAVRTTPRPTNSVLVRVQAPPRKTMPSRNAMRECGQQAHVIPTRIREHLGGGTGEGAHARPDIPVSPLEPDNPAQTRLVVNSAAANIRQCVLESRLA